MNLKILYRGELTSCNYSCTYCPFSKRGETAAQIGRDRSALRRFSTWIQEQKTHEWKIMFTPWGEALVRSWYRDAVVDLSHTPHVETVAVQTNLSCGLRWLAHCRRERLSLWATFHPTETTSIAFAKQVRAVHDQGIRICVGVVGVPEFLEKITELQRQLPGGLYLWVNAQQPRPRPYTTEEIARFQAIDPYFPLTARRQPSLGKLCSTGELSFTVDANGDMRRCRSVDEVLANCYEPDWETALRPRVCPRRFCDCYLGKSQFLADGLHPYFGSTALERLPTDSQTMIHSPSE